MNSSYFRPTACLFLAMIVVVFVNSISAQDFRGTISGTITDPNGAVVPGATVTVKHTETNITSTATSNSDGVYTVPLLSPGAYTVSAAASGFKTSTVENVTV